MDDLLREFLAETGEHLETVDVELLRLERHPDDQAILRNIFRLVHTIKGTCGFLGLPRIEALAHAAETLMGQLRNGRSVTSEVVTLILASVDRIKLMLAELERAGQEPDGSDAELISELERVSGGSGSPNGGDPDAAPEQVLLRPLRPGEVPLDELERVFRLAPGPPAGSPSGFAGKAPGPGLLPRGAAEEVAPETHGRNQTVRVALDTLERLTATVSELVLTRNQLTELARRDAKVTACLAAPLQRLSQVTTELQDGIMKTRMQPVGTAWSKLPRLVRDLSAELGKSIGLTFKGGETELDRQVLDVIRDPLTHLVRNCAAHGIEDPADRRAAGKPEQGLIRLEACGEDGGIVIALSDDGRGLDLDSIRRRAVELDIGTGPEVARLTDDQLIELIFRPGFSTARAADAVSGRGVGMDVVRTNVDSIGGAVDITTEAGRGTTVKIRLPMTLAIMPVLIVEVATQRFALPQAAILELVRVGPGTEHVLERIHGAMLVRLRETMLPVVELAATLSPSAAGAPSAGFVVVVQLGRVRLGLLVEALIETEEVVVKPISARLRPLNLFSGTTLLGDGSVVLILDPRGLARRVGIEPRNTDEPLSEPVTDGSPDTATLLVYRGAAAAFQALPLPLVARLEEIDVARIEQAGGRATAQYRGRLMPLLPATPGTRLRQEGMQPVVIVSTGASLAGLIVDEVVDIVEAPLALEPAPGRPDLLGTAIVRGRATEVVDLAAILPRAGAIPVRGTATRGAKVLLVEHDPFFRELLIPVLASAGYRVVTAASAEDALALLLDGPVDAVVTDLDLPDRPGLDLVEAMRRHPGTATLPVVLSTSDIDDETLRRARALGICEVVPKLDRVGLVSVLSRAVWPQDLAA